MVPAGKRLLAPAHSRDHHEETVYGLDGVIALTVDGVSIDVGSGQAICIPCDAIHRSDNNGNVNVKGFCAVTPAGLGRSASARQGNSLGTNRRSARPRKADGPDASHTAYSGPATASRRTQVPMATGSCVVRASAASKFAFNCAYEPDAEHNL